MIGLIGDPIPLHEPIRGKLHYRPRPVKAEAEHVFNVAGPFGNPWLYLRHHSCTVQPKGEKQNPQSSCGKSGQHLMSLPLQVNQSSSRQRKQPPPPRSTGDPARRFKNRVLIKKGPKLSPRTRFLHWDIEKGNSVAID